MLKIWSQTVIDAWVEVFSELIQIIPQQAIDDDINKIIFYLSDSSQPAVSRYIAGRMIGIISLVGSRSLRFVAAKVIFGNLN